MWGMRTPDVGSVAAARSMVLAASRREVELLAEAADELLGELGHVELRGPAGVRRSTARARCSRAVVSRATSLVDAGPLHLDDHRLARRAAAAA